MIVRLITATTITPTNYPENVFMELYALENCFRVRKCLAGRTVRWVGMHNKCASLLGKVDPNQLWGTGGREGEEGEWWVWFVGGVCSVVWEYVGKGCIWWGVPLM